MNAKREKRALLEEVIFAQVIGMALFIYSFIGYFKIDSIIVERITLLTGSLGILLVLIGIVYPYILKTPMKAIKKLTNAVFNLILKSILILIYIVFVIPYGAINGKKIKKNNGFYYWNGDNEHKDFKGFDKILDPSRFDDSYEKTNKFTNVIKIFSYFIYKKDYFLLPILVVLIVLGLVFFFITSSIFTPLIYPLF